MYSVRLTAFAALVSLGLGQSLNGFPACAVPCIEQGIGNSTCSATDYYCQCTTGAQTINNVATYCLCHSQCTTTDLIAVIQNTNKVCSSALAASSQTYTTSSLNIAACATASVPPTVSAASKASTTPASSAASMSGMTDSAGSKSATASATSTAASSQTGSGSASAASQTKNAAATMVGYQGAMFGLVGLAVLAA